jgi:hypothetical protein
VTTRDLAKLGLALLVGAAIAFPAGMMVAGSGGDSDGPAPANRQSAASVRDVFSPSIRTDPWFLERQREGVEALERHCTQTGESCPEARAARVALAKLEAAD